MFKKVTTAILLASALFGVTACGGNGNDGGKTVINFFGWSNGEAEKRNFQTMINAFMAANPDIKVTYDVIEPSTYPTTLTNKRKSLPEVFYMPDYTFDKWVTSGRLLDLSPYVSKEERARAWPVVCDMYAYDPATKKVGVGDSLYGISKDLGPYAIVYNKDLMREIFQAKGMPENYPSTTEPMSWAQFIDFLKSLKYEKDIGGKMTTIYGIGSYELQHAVWSNNADFWDEEVKTSRINEPNFIQACQFIKDMMYKDGVMPDPVTYKGSAAYTKFLSGQCLMTFMGPWDMATWWNEVKFEYDVMPTPYGPAEGAVSTSWIGSVALSARTFKKGEEAKRDASVKLIKYLTLEDESARLNYQLGQAQPNVIEIANNEWVNNVGLDGVKQYPKSKEVFVNITKGEGKVKYHNRARYYLYDETVYRTLESQFSQQCLTGESVVTAEEFCNRYHPEFQAALDEDVKNRGNGN